MPLLEVRRLGGVLDRLLRPDRAALNAQEAAWDAASTIRERQAVERAVGELEDSDSADQ